MLSTSIEKDPTAGGHLLGQMVVGHHGDLLVAGHHPGGQREAITGAEGDGPSLEASEPDLRTLQILQDADVHSELMGHLTDRGDPRGVVLVIPVGKVEAEGGGACLDQPPQHIGGLGGGSDGGHDLGASHVNRSDLRLALGGNYHPGSHRQRSAWTSPHTNSAPGRRPGIPTSV
jgi:hypothetical protein